MLFVLIQNWFEIFNKSRTHMISCKLDKSKSGYVRGMYCCIKVSCIILDKFIAILLARNQEGCRRCGSTP